MLTLSRTRRVHPVQFQERTNWQPITNSWTPIRQFSILTKSTETFFYVYLYLAFFRIVYNISIPLQYIIITIFFGESEFSRIPSELPVFPLPEIGRSAGLFPCSKTLITPALVHSRGLNGRHLTNTMTTCYAKWLYVIAPSL